MFFKNPRTFFFLSLLLLRLPVGLEFVDDEDDGIGGVFAPLPWPLVCPPLRLVVELFCELGIGDWDRESDRLWLWPTLLTLP